MGEDFDGTDDAGDADGDDGGDDGDSQADADAEMADLREDAIREDITGPPVDPNDPRTGEEIAAQRRGDIESSERVYDNVLNGGMSTDEAALLTGNQVPGEVLDDIDRRLGTS